MVQYWLDLQYTFSIWTNEIPNAPTIIWRENLFHNPHLLSDTILVKDKHNGSKLPFPTKPPYEISK